MSLQPSCLVVTATTMSVTRPTRTDAVRAGVISLVRRNDITAILNIRSSRIRRPAR